jgi:squalene-hopene/tetraprenyl-beta-curcumene cyclase
LPLNKIAYEIIYGDIPRALLLLFATAPAFVAAQQPITLNDVEVGLPDISADEPIAAEYSAERAAGTL